MRERMQMGAKRQHAASERNQAEQEDEAASQPDAALPPYRREHAADATIINIAGKVPNPNDSMTRKPGTAPAVLAAWTAKA